ncbi:hypothetical protein K3495_g15191, partial [Podosphaera aphanis]
MAHRGSQGNAYQQPKPYQNGGRWQGPDARMPMKEEPSSKGRGGYAGRGIEMGGSGGQRTVPPKNLSRHPIINGSQKYDRGMGSLCLSCGTLGHRRPECNGKPLQFWEQGYLKDILNQSLSSNFSGFGADQRGPRYRDIENSNWRPKDNEILIGGARRQVQEPARERQIESDIPHLTYEEYNGIQSSDEPTNSARCMSVVIGFDGEMQESRQESSIEDSLDVLTLESNLNEGNTRKRARTMDIHDILNEDEQEVKIKKKSSKRERRTKKQLREIVGRLGKGPVNYKNMAEDIRVNLSLMELFQISPDLSKAFRTLSTRVNERTMKERMRTELRKGKEKADLASDSEVLYGTAAGSSGIPSEKAFRIPVEVKTERDGKTIKVSLPENLAQADQGSDMIIVTVGFLKKFGLSCKSLSSRGLNGLTMNVADGTSARLTHYAQFEIGVLGVWRKVEAFVRPFSARNSEEVHLLLGLPWLHTVCAKIWIKESIIEIGDPERGEKMVKIQGPVFEESREHKLVLCPKRKKQVTYAESSSEESDDEDTDDESSSDEEDILECLMDEISGKKRDL